MRQAKSVGPTIPTPRLSACGISVRACFVVPWAWLDTAEGPLMYNYATRRREMRITGLLRLVLAAAIAESGALAIPITYTMTATASGTFAGVAFTNSAITVTSVANTN